MPLPIMFLQRPDGIHRAPCTPPRRTGGTIASLIAGGLIGALWLAPWPVRAQEGGLLLRSPLPYWSIGQIDQQLSKQCSDGQFNQRIPFQFRAQFTGPTGPGLLGGAKGTGLNLQDPGKLADPGFDYWFYRDGTNLCLVFKSALPTPPPS